MHRYLIADTPVGPQIFTLSSLVVADNSIGSVKDTAGRTVILFKAYRFGAVIIVLKIKDVFNGSSAELVYALVVITNYTALPYESASGVVEAGTYLLVQEGGAL